MPFGAYSLLSSLRTNCGLNGGNKTMVFASFLDFVISCYSVVDVEKFEVFLYYVVGVV